MQHESGAWWYRWGADVRQLDKVTLPPRPDAVFAFPPCTNLAVSGAAWFKDKGPRGVIDGLETVESCRVFCEASGAPWMIENPVSTLASFWREPDYRFQPADFAGYADDPHDEAYTKKTCLWTGGGFVYPRKRPVDAVLGSKFHLLPPSADRGDLRSVTPQGFARAVFDSNGHVLERCED